MFSKNKKELMRWGLDERSKHGAWHQKRARPAVL